MLATPALLSAFLEALDYFKNVELRDPAEKDLKLRRSPCTTGIRVQRENLKHSNYALLQQYSQDIPASRSSTGHLRLKDTQDARTARRRSSRT